MNTNLNTPARVSLLFALLLTGSSVFTQATIFEALALEPAGCSLAAPHSGENGDSWMMEEVPDDFIMEEPVLPEGYSSVDEVMATLSNWLEQENQKSDSFLAGKLDWRDGLQFFLQDGKWGLREAGRRKPRIKPRFDAIIADTAHQGFVGYVNGRCNYYFTNGKAQLPGSDYLHVQPLLQDAFIVITTNGYGLLGEQGKEILPPGQLGIYPLQRGKPHLKVRYEEESFYWLNLQNGQKTYFHNNYFGLNFLNDRYVLIDGRTLVDLQEARQVFCGEKVAIKVLDKEKGYLAVASDSDPLVNYITNLKGELVSKEAFAKVDAYLPTGHFVVGYVKDYVPGGSQRILSGVINEQGEWTVPASYNLLETKLFGGKYLQLTQSSKEIGLVSLTGKEPVERRAYTYFGEEPDGKQLKIIWQEEDEKQAALLHLTTGELTTLASPGYWKRYPIGECGTTTLYRALGVDGQMLINEQDEPLLDEPADYISEGSKPGLFRVMRKKFVNGRNRNVTEIVDCTGQILPAEKVNKIDLMLDDDFYYVQKASGEDVFVLPGGQEVASPYSWKPYRRNFGEDHFVLYRQGDLEGLVNRAGEVVLPPIFHGLYVDKVNGLVKVVSVEEQRYLQADGSPLFGPEFSRVEYLNYGLFKIYQAGKWGIGRRDGKIILPPAYDNIYLERGIIVGYNPMGEVELYDFAGNRLSLPTK